MGAQAGNVRLAGDAAGRQKAAAEGVRMRREALNRANQGGGSGPAVVGEEPGSSPYTIARQEAFAARPGQETPFERRKHHSLLLVWKLILHVQKSALLPLVRQLIVQSALAPAWASL